MPYRMRTEWRPRKESGFEHGSRSLQQRPICILAVAELESRVTIIDKTGTPVSFLGDNPNQAQWANFGVPPQEQKLGIFTAPHGLSFDKAGNLYVQDWNQTGRVTKLTKL